MFNRYVITHNVARTASNANDAHKLDSRVSYTELQQHEVYLAHEHDRLDDDGCPNHND